MIKMCFCKALYYCASIHPYVDFRICFLVFNDFLSSFFFGGGGCWSSHTLCNWFVHLHPFFINNFPFFFFYNNVEIAFYSFAKQIHQTLAGPLKPLPILTPKLHLSHIWLMSVLHYCLPFIPNWKINSSNCSRAKVNPTEFPSKHASQTTMSMVNITVVLVGRPLLPPPQSLSYHDHSKPQ